jgi:2'-5' RNA ligase
MQSIVIAIDEPYRERIEEVAGEIKAVTGRKDLAAATRPHITLHVAERYEPTIDAVLAGFAAAAPLATVRTGDVGVFRGPQVVVALEVIRDEALTRFQAKLAAAIAPLADAPKPAYAPDTWAPHITIVAGQIEEQHIDAVMAVLGRRDFAWTVPVTNICHVPGPRAREWTRFDLGTTA